MFVIVSITAYAWNGSNEAVVNNEPSIVDASSVSSTGVQSFSDCDGFSALPTSHTFNCGSCTKYVITAEHNHNTQKGITIQERDATGNQVKSYSLVILPGVCLIHEEVPNPSTVKVYYSIGVAPYLVSGTVCLSTQ
ncbi:MAG: hypothetical protein LBD11_07725 [Candidatus Peribacteria bacterium]|nr:hypothetical protein [Candidatus Peribacteria bacterium]